MKYICPLCKTPLTEKHFHDVIKIQEKKEKVQRGDLEKFKKQAAAAKEALAAGKRREKEIKLKAKQDAESARKQATEAEQRKSSIRNKRLMARIGKLEQEKKMLQTHTSPQEIGLADEKVLVSCLEKEFPDDEIQKKGQEGDVLHFVKFNGENSGCIVYECKHTDRIAAAHIEQIASDKKLGRQTMESLLPLGRAKAFLD